MRTPVSNAVDRAIGSRLRVYRKAAGLSQADLGSKLGVTFQQVQKYENGKNRLAGSRMLMVCDALKIAPADLLGTVGKHNGALVEQFEAMRDGVVAQMVAALGELPQELRRQVASATMGYVTAYRAALLHGRTKPKHAAKT